MNYKSNENSRDITTQYKNPLSRCPREIDK